MVTHTTSRPNSAYEARHAALWGTLLGLTSAVGYTSANVFLRAATGLDPILVSAVKAGPTVLAVAPWLIVGVLRRVRVFPDRRVMLALVMTGFFGQVGGNVMFQISLGIIGMALTVPLCLGTIIFSSAILGRVLLNESVTRMTALSMLLLIGAIWSLSLGAGDASQLVLKSQASAAMIAAGVAAACLSGFAYAVLGVAIRYAVSKGATVTATTFTVSLIGVASLGAWSMVRIGLEDLQEIHSPEWTTMLLAGVFNLIAFIALTRALQLTTLLYVNALNASQVAMAAIAGVTLFGEAASPALGLGIGLTVLGLLLMPRHRPAESDQRPSEFTNDSRVQNPSNLCSSLSSASSSQTAKGPTESAATGATISDASANTLASEDAQDK